MANLTRGIRVAGNWKMNHHPQAVADFFSKLNSELKNLTGSPNGAALDVSIAPHFLALNQSRDLISTLSPQPKLRIEILSQNVHWEDFGAFTGEISPLFLKEYKIAGSLVGHSERRQYFGESNLTAAKRAAGLLKHGLRIIFCVGETRAERESGKTKDILKDQLKALFDLNHKDPGKNFLNSAFISQQLEIAYEPVWAIGTGLTASPEQAQEAHAFIRAEISQALSGECAKKARILYGGSVTPENFSGLLFQEDVDGGLVGGASLKPESFFKLLQIACSR